MKPRYSAIQFAGTFRKSSIFMGMIAMGLASPLACAADLYWDINGTTANTGASATGNWNGTTSNWNSDPTGGAAGTTTATTSAGDVLHFSSGTDFTNAFTITASNVQLADSLVFEEGTVTVAGTGTIDFGSSTSAIDVASGRTGTISAFIKGTNGLTKTGTGNLVLGNTANSQLSGSIVVKAGALASGSNTTNSTNGQPVSLGDSSGSASATFSVNRNQNYNSSVVVNSGSTGIKRISGGPGLSANQTPTLTGSVILDADLTLGNGSAGVYSANNYGGVVLGGVITGSTKITVDGFNAFVDPQTYLTNLTNATGAVTIARLSGNNVGSFTGSVDVVRGVMILSGTTSLSSANVVTVGTTAAALDVQGGVTVGGLNDTLGVGGTVLAGSGAQTLTLGGNGNYSFAGLITNPVVGNTSAGLSLTIGNGANITNQTFSGTNSYAGTTTVANFSKLTLGNANSLGNNGMSRTAGAGGTTVASGGTLDLNGQSGVTEALTLNGTGSSSNGALINGSATPSSLAGGAVSSLSISGATSGVSAGSTVSFVGGGGTGAAASISLGVTAASFTIDPATTTIYSAAPTVTISGGGGANATATAVLTAGVVSGITVTNAGFGYTSAPTIAFTGGTVTTAGTNPTGTGNSLNFSISGIQVTTNGSGYTSAPTISLSSGTATITANLASVTLASDSSVGGSGDISVNPPISGSSALTKVGSNKVTLAGANTYSGLTQIDSGRIDITGSIAGGALVNSSGVLSGTGIVGGSVQVSSGGHLASTIAATPGAQDPLDIVGALVIDSGNVIDLTASSTPASGVYILATTTEGVSYTPGSVNLTGLSGTVSVSGNNLIVTVTAAAGYSGWASSNAGGGTANLDYDKDGVSNGIEYFMNAAAGFTASPGLVGGTVTWVNGGNISSSSYGTQFVVQSSTDLVNWTNVPLGSVTNTSGSISYTPTGVGKSFARLVVIPN
jgi:autotransporter-associated beta strand protein